MHYADRYRLHPTEAQREMLDFYRDTCRQLYNHALTEFEKTPESAGTLNQRVRHVRDQLPDLKDWWDDLNSLYSTVAQATVMRIEDSVKAPNEFRSFTYVQSGFEFDNRNGQTVLSLSKLADILISYHREIPDSITVKEVCLKKEWTGDWYASFAVEGKDEPENPDNPTRRVGIDIGILKYAHDTDGRAVGSLDLQDERERLTREQRSLSRKQLGETTAESSRVSPASQAETPRLLAQVLKLLRFRV